MPFSVEQFFQVFEMYNRAVFPTQAVLVVMALVMAILATRPFPLSSKIISLFLAFLWLWMGIVYHLLFFSKINPGAFVFAAFFTVQGLMFFHQGVVHSRLAFRAGRDIYGTVGFLFILYALVVYPILGYARGGAYPFMPTFGLPCPTSIFTFGILLLTAKRPSPLLLIIPFLWSLVGTYAGLDFGIGEDLGLPVAGIITVALLLYRRAGEDERDELIPSRRPV